MALLASLPVIGLAGCAPQPTDATFDTAEAAALALCGDGNYVVKNESFQPFGASASFVVVATCLEEPPVAWADVPDVIAGSVGVPVEEFAEGGGDVDEFTASPQYAYFEVEDFTYERPWEQVTIYDLSSIPGGTEDEPGEGPQISVGGRAER